MKLLRYGAPGSERPAMVDANGKIRDISAHVADLSGSVLDPANLFETGPLDEQRELVAAAVELVGEHLIMAHAKDRAADGSFVAAGKGVIDFRHFVGRLRAAGFDGDLVAHGLAAAEAPGVAQFLAELT